MDIYTGILIGYMVRTFQKEIVAALAQGLEWMTNTGKYAKGKGGSGAI